MNSRPKPGETEEDILKLQEEFLKNKLQPSAKYINCQNSSDKKINEQVEVRKEEIKSDESRILLGGIVERQTQFVPHDFDNKSRFSGGFPQAKRRQNTTSTKKGSIFAQQNKRLKDEHLPEPMNVISEDTSSSSTIDEKNLPDQSYIITGKEREQIHQENIGTLSKMSVEEILEEQQNLVSKMDPDIVRFLKSKRTVAEVTSVSESKQQVSEQPVNVQEIETPKGILENCDLEKWLHFDKVETEKLQWMKDIDVPKKLVGNEEYEARFDFAGRLLPYVDKEISEKNRTLYHHGEEPGRPGYTLKELFQFCRSSVQQQRILALNTVANILQLNSTGVYDDVIDIPLEQIFFIIRVSLDDNTPTVLHSSIRAMHSLFCNRIDEMCLDSLLGFGCGNVQPMLTVDKQDTSKEEDKEINDQQMAELNLVKCLARTDILIRISELEYPLLRNLNYHFRHTNIEDSSYTLQRHFAALMNPVSEVSLIDCALITNIVPLFIKCVVKYSVQVSNLCDFKCGKLQIISSLLFTMGNIVKSSAINKYDYVEKHIEAMLGSTGFTTITNDIKLGSNLLCVYEPHKSGANFGSVEAAVWRTSEHVVPCLHETSCVPFLTAVTYYVEMSGDRLILKLLRYLNIAKYLTALNNCSKLNLITNWFTRLEGQLLINIFSCVIVVEKFLTEHPFFYELTVKCLPIFNIAHKVDVDYLLRNIVFKQNFLPNEVPLEYLSLYDDKFDMNALDYLDDIYRCYSHVLGLQQNLDIFTTNLTLDIRIGNVMPADWVFCPIVSVYADHQVNESRNVNQHRLCLTVIRCLQWIQVFETYFPTLASLVNPTERFCRIACVFLCSNSLFLEPKVHQLLENCLRMLLRENSTNMHFDKEIQGLNNFQDFYVQLLEQYQAVSYGDTLFANYILVPLTQKHNVKWRKILWSEYMGVAQTIMLSKEQCFINIQEFLEPAESDLKNFNWDHHQTSQNMSSKGSKRRHRRINTHEEQPEKKVEEIIEQSDDSKSNISTDTDKLEKDPPVKEENGNAEQNKTTQDVVEATVPNGNDSGCVKEIVEMKIVSVETVNGRADSEITVSQSTDSSDTQKSLVTDANSDLEPLVLDSEADTELQFPSETGSDRSSEIDKSPVLTRCQTRRSQTRNLPTPKTPKALDFNGEAECKSEIRVNITRLATAPEVIVTPATDSEENTMETLSFDVRNEIPEDAADDCEESEEDLADASVFVNYTGNDTTRNLDITTTSAADEGPSFLDTAKDMSYGETLRGISGRRALRHHPDTYRPRLYKSTVDLTSKDLADGIKKFTPLTPAPSGGTKRKLLNRDSPEEFKRVKTDGDGSGLLSYIQSPFKSKLGRTEIPSSTPKLTSYKYTAHPGTTIVDEVSKIELELHERPNNSTEPKKWCSIM
ncbi:uncharacterized protein CBL_05035 [Carabus blaptoides fortunei]